MILRLAALVGLLASPVAAEAPDAAVCAGVWSLVTDAVPVTGRVAGVTDGWCEIADVVLDLPGQYVPDWHADRLRLRGSALPWALGKPALPERLEAEVQGLRLVVQTDNPQMDYLFAAQARAYPIAATLALRWDKAVNTLHLDRLDIDFPGTNAVSLTAEVGRVDLSSVGAMQMALTGFAITRARLSVTTHGLFESYGLMALGAAMLPYEGDMASAVATRKAEAGLAIAGLPEATFPGRSRAALWALVQELPNPSGRLVVDLRADAGFGPARLGGYAMTGMPASPDEAAALFEGVVLDVAWTHDEDR